MAAYPNSNHRALMIIPKGSRLIESKKCVAMGRLLCPLSIVRDFDVVIAIEIPDDPDRPEMIGLP